MTVSLIISTYNWPRALYLCLDSVMQQTAMPTEILIADDGSGISTRDVVRHFEAVSPVPIRHIWHEDKGFRLAMIRINAIAASRCEYIIQIDGDLILQRNFIQDHMIFAQRGCYVTGSRGIITEMLTRKVLSGEITSLTPLMRGVRNSNNVIRIPLMAFLYRTLGPTRFVKGCNMAFWRNDLIRVNGYDESFCGWGRWFAETVDTFDRFDEVWVIARHEKALEELRDRVPYPIRALALDLTDRRSFQTYADALAEEPVEVGLLVNASGFGKFRAVVDTPLEVNLNMTDLNCQAVVALCQLSAPYMPRGGQIINFASVAAFQPIPYINVYGATKAFVLSFSRALNRELRSRGIRVMALCPFWTRTAFFARATTEGGESVVKKYVAMYEPEQLVQRAWRDARRGRDVSQFGFVARFQTALTKLLPHSLVMDVWMRQQKLQ